jgi:hypothetical protein
MDFHFLHRGKYIKHPSIIIRSKRYAKKDTLMRFLSKTLIISGARCACLIYVISRFFYPLHLSSVVNKLHPSLLQESDLFVKGLLIEMFSIYALTSPSLNRAPRRADFVDHQHLTTTLLDLWSHVNPVLSEIHIRHVGDLR